MKSLVLLNEDLEIILSKAAEYSYCTHREWTETGTNLVLCRHCHCKGWWVSTSLGREIRWELSWR